MAFAGGTRWYIPLHLYLTGSSLQQEGKRTSFFIFLILNRTQFTAFACFPAGAKERAAKRFSASGVVNFTTLHLSNEDKTLYVGAREILFALNLTDISEVTLHRNVRAKHL